MRESNQQRLQQALPPHRLWDYLHFGHHRQWTRGGCDGLPEESENHDGQVQTAPLRSRPPLCPHVTFLGSGRSQDLVFREFYVRFSPRDLHREPVQQCFDPGLYKFG